MVKSKNSRVRKYFKNDFSINSLKLFSGYASGHLIIFFSGPVLSRLYSPADFGVYALMSSIAAVLATLGTGCYEFAIVTVKTHREAYALSILSITLSFILSVVSALTMGILFYWTTLLSGSPIHYGWLLIPVFILAQGLLNVSNYHLNRLQRYGRISAARVSRSIMMVSSQIGIGATYGHQGLFTGMLLGHILAAVMQIRHLLKSYFRALKTLRLSEILKTARENYKFPAYLLPEQLLNTLSVQAPIFILQLFFTSVAVGLYSLPHRFLSIPVVLAGTSIGQVFFRKASLAQGNPREMALLTRQLFRFLFWLGVLPFSLLTIYGDILFQFFFGIEWVEAGSYAQIISPWLLFVLIGSPLSNLFNVTGRQKLSLILNVYLFLARTIALVVGAWFFSSGMVSIVLFSLVSFLFWFYLAFYNLKLAGTPIRPLLLEVVFGWGSALIVFGGLRLLLNQLDLWLF